MKHKIERTNPSAKRFSTRTIAMVLSIVMLIGSIATGSMLSTFAAYLDNAAQADAVTQAAAQGGDIALNAIPSDDAEAKPNLSGLEENEIVGGMKSDLASVSAQADLALTGDSSTHYIVYNTSNNNNVSEWSSSNLMKHDGTYYWGALSVTASTNFFIMVSTDTSYTNDVLTSSRTVSLAGTVNSGEGANYNYGGKTYYTARGSSTASGTVYVRWDGSNGILLTSNKPSGYDSMSDSGSGSGSGSGTVSSNSLSAIYFKANTSGGWYWSENNARVKAKVTYSDNTTLEAYMTEIPGTSTSIRVLPIDSSKQATKVQFYRKAADDDSDTWATSNEVTIQEGKNYFKQPDSPTGWNNWDPVQDTYSEFTGDLPAVLSGTKVMFYFGDNYKNEHAKTLNTKSGDTVTHILTEERPLMCDDSAWTTYYLSYYQSNGTLSNKDYEPAVACVPSQKYYISNNTTWEGRQMGENAEAGKAYYATSSGVSTGQARGGASFSNSSYTMVQGTAASGVSATATYSTSAINETNRVFYAIKKSGETNYYDFNPNNASNLSVGTYTVYALVADGGLIVNAANATLTVNTPTYYDVTVKSNNARLGTGTASPTSAYAGQTVTVTINENMGTIKTVTATDASDNAVAVSGTGTSRTFTMPASAVTVNLTFEDYVGTSNFYYNSYETSGSPSSSRYGQQMTEGRINGQEFSYYHVEGRTGNDQLFTVSYKNPDYPANTAVYFTAPSSWSPNHGWDGDPYAIFYATDGTYIQDWSKMTYDGDDNGNKRWRIDIPDGAYKWQVKVDKGDYPKTMTMELGWGGTDALFYITKYGVDGNGEYDQIGHTWFNHDNPVGDMYENFNGEGKYTNNFSTKGFNNHNANRGGSHSYTKPKDLGTDSGDYYIVVLYKNKEYTINGETHTVGKDPEIIWMPKLPGTEDIDSSEINVYGKDGPIVIDWNNKTASGATGTSGTAYGYSLIADTELYDSDGTTKIGQDVDDDGASYEKAKVVVTSEDSANIVIKTTIANAYRSKYYLKGWCINGETYACGTNAKGVNAENAGTNGVYTMTYTIPSGTEDSANIEITPIYYLTSSYKSDNGITTVTFFLEGYNTITEKWGDTPYIYPFYGNLNNVDNSFGVYPGQPMVFAAGQYSVEVPVNKNVPIAKTPGSTVVKGITINNGYADHVHRNLVYKWSDHDNDQEHKQTYDYDDFYKIYEECLKNGNEHPNSIIFRIQDEETVFNRAQYGGGKSGQFAAGTSNISISDIATSGNGWELLVNRYDNAVNIFGSHDGINNPGSGVTAVNDTANALYVVSTGYNANIAGDYGTMWKIYNGSGQLISNAGGRVGVPPSVLLLRGSSSGYDSAVDALNYPSANRSVDGVGSYTDSIDDYEAIYKALQNSSYTGKRVYITYEKDAQDTRKVTSGTGANRLDGRWYYTHKSDQVQSKIGIEYWDNAQNKWVTDTIPSDSITGSHTKCTAKFNDNDTTTSNLYTIENNLEYSFTASTVSGWKFDSWQIKYSDTSYDPIATTASATMPATLSYNIVARFVPTTTGDLRINHTLNKASSGKGSVEMEVNVYTDSSKTTPVTGGSKTGSSVYLDGTFINNNDASNYVIEITLKTTPIYDGKVSQFTYDKFNSDNAITATTSPADLKNAAENALTTSTFTIPVSSLYNVGTLTTRELNYTSLIDETLHYYNFTYNLTTRGEDPKTYTSKGVINKAEYEKIVSDQKNHVLDNSVLVDKAPFESNFLKSNTLREGTISYNSGTHTYTASSTFEQSGAVPKYHVRFALPYAYLTSGDAGATPPTKKYTVTDNNAYNVNLPTFDLVANYNTFITIDATDTTVGTQTEVDKVTDGSDVNHVGNNFITAPEELKDGNTTMYFQYWDIKKLKSDGSAGDDVAKIYYPDFHYRVYNNYYVRAVYSDKPEDSWKHKYSEVNNKDVDCSVLYLGDSRNQWNYGGGESSSDQDVAADMIYNDFIFHYTYKGQELSTSTEVEVGMILERATYKDTADNNKQKWLTGSTSVNDMSYYRATYGGDNANSTEEARKTAILNALNSNGSTALPSGTIQQKWNNNVLNNKNFTEQSYSVYSQFGQTVANDTITFAKDNVIDNYAYRAYAYIKDKNGSYTLSDPVYFCMRYTSNLKYTE